MIPQISVQTETEIGKIIAKSHAGMRCDCGPCRRWAGLFIPLSKTAQKKAKRAAAAKL